MCRVDETPYTNDEFAVLVLSFPFLALAWVLLLIAWVPVNGIIFVYGTLHVFATSVIFPVVASVCSFVYQTAGYVIESLWRGALYLVNGACSCLRAPARAQASRPESIASSESVKSKLDV